MDAARPGVRDNPAGVAPRARYFNPVLQDIQTKLELKLDLNPDQTIRAFESHLRLYAPIVIDALCS
jgi:hypothetical protein